ncbi:hypothetical protein ACFOYW_12505 [Gryllotalpicola reticulitermitis]|uniref:Bacterial Pleckstrin homology domain-containing protein n=1 Tax=Gryllotalpicola reticulitermitis TaxID=1184153 RepID=A0ABV8Q740_9MICO
MQALGGVLIGVGAAVGVLAIVWWGINSARRARSDAAGSDAAGLADVIIEDGRLIVVPRGPWKVLSLTTRIVASLNQVVGCRADPDPRSSHPANLRVGGTGLPGRVRAGYMVGADGPSWWLYRYGGSAIVIELDGNRLAYLVIEVDDPGRTIEMIRRAAATR